MHNRVTHLQRWGKIEQESLGKFME